MFNSAHFHPMLVHFPIALLIIGFLADVFSLLYKKEACLSRMGFYLEITGALAVAAAWFTGYFFTANLSGEAGAMREKHALFALITLITILIATSFRIFIVMRKKHDTNLKFISLGLFFVAAFFVSVTGFLGGSLVMDYLIGI